MVPDPDRDTPDELTTDERLRKNLADALEAMKARRAHEMNNLTDDSETTPV